MLYSPVTAFEVKFKSETWLLWDSGRFTVLICLIYHVVKRLWFIYIFNLQALAPNKSDKRNELWKDSSGFLTECPGRFSIHFWAVQGSRSGENRRLLRLVMKPGAECRAWRFGGDRLFSPECGLWAQGRRAVCPQVFSYQVPQGLKCETRSSRLSTSCPGFLAKGGNSSS